PGGNGAGRPPDLVLSPPLGAVEIADEDQVAAVVASGGAGADRGAPMLAVRLRRRLVAADQVQAEPLDAGRGQAKEGRVHARELSLGNERRRTSPDHHPAA